MSVTLDEFMKVDTNDVPSVASPIKGQQSPTALSAVEFLGRESSEFQLQERRGLLDSVKYLIGEGVIKPLAQGIELIPASAESILQVAFDSVRDIAQKQLRDDRNVLGASEEEILQRTPDQKRRIELNSKVVQNMDSAIRVSKNLQDNWIKSTQVGKEASSEEFLKTSPMPFSKNFSMARMLALGTQSVPMLGLAAAVTAATRSPTMGAAVVGITQAADEYNVARERGVSTPGAQGMFIANSIMLSAFETVPLTSFMKGGKLPIRMFRTAAQEGGEEVLQQLWVNSVAKLGYDKTRKLTEGMMENFIGGFISGGVIGGFGPGEGHSALLKEAKDAELDVDTMQEAVASQVIEHADAITESFLSKAAPEALIGEEGFSPARTLAQKVIQEQVDPVQDALTVALAPLPQVELTPEELAQLSVKKREGGFTQDVSKSIPDRGVVQKITAMKEFKEADREKQLQLLIEGRTAELVRLRKEIQDKLSSLRTGLSQAVPKLFEMRQQQIEQLSDQLVAIDMQLEGVEESTIEALSQEKLLLPGETLESLRKKARSVGARIEKARVEQVYRNKKAQAQERRVALVKYLQARLPGVENAKLREKYNLRSAKDMTEEKLQKFFDEIEELRNTVRAKQLRERAGAILDKMRPVIGEGGVKQGRFKDSGLQTVANEIIRVAELSAVEAEQELAAINKQMVQVLEAGEGESELADDLRFKAALLSKVSGLEQRNTDQLESALDFLSKQLAQFQMGRDVVKELRKAQRIVEERDIVADIKKITWDPKNGLQKIIKISGKNISRLFQFSGFNLGEFWNELGSGKGAQFVKKMVVDPLQNITRSINALGISMDHPVRQAMKKIYGVPLENTREYMKFLTERMSIDPSEDPQVAPYVKTVKLNNGTEQNFKLSRWDVMYWYASAYEKEGVPDVEAYEILTGDNALAAIEQQARTEVQEGQTVEELIDQKRGAIKGNAIPVDILEDMFSTLTPQDRQFAMEMRQIFTSFWPLVNPVYSRATGVDMTFLDNYMPRIRKTASIKSVEDLFNEYAMVEAHVTPFPGSAEERRSTSTAPFVQIGLMDVFMGFRDTMSNWIATYDITSRMQRYLKNRTIRAAINEATDGVQDIKTGEWKDGSFVKLMDFHLKGLVSRGRTDNTIRPPAMEVLRRNFSRSVLAHPKQFTLQLSSAFTAIQTIGHENFVKGIASFMRDPKGSIAILNKALSMHNRYGNIMIEMKEIQDLIRLQKTRFADKFNWFDKYAFMFVRAGNKGGIMLGGWAVFKEAYDRTGDLNKAYKAFDDFVLNTQQSALREQQSAATVGPQRYLWQFVSAVSQYARIYHRSWADVIRNPSSQNWQKWGRTMVIFHLYIPLVRWAISQIGVPAAEDDEDKQKRLNMLKAQMLTGPFAGLWILGDLGSFVAQVITGYKGFDSGPAVIQEMNKVKHQASKAIRTALEEDADMEDVLKEFFKAEKGAAGLIGGVPRELTDSIQMLYLHSQGEWDAADTPGMLYGHSVEMINYHRGRF